MTATRTAPRPHVTASRGVAAFEAAGFEAGSFEAGSFEAGSRIELPDLSVAPGPELAAAIASLVLTDLSVAATIEVAAACQRLTRWIQGTQLLALAEYGKSQVWTGEPEARDDPKGVRAKQYGASDLDALSEFADREVSCALGIAPMTAAVKLGMAQDLDQRLTATRDLMLAGLLDEHKARLIVRSTRVLKTSNAVVVEAQILPRAAKLSYRRLKSELARLVIAVDPASASERHERARQRRMVSTQRGEDGMGTLCANLTADGITTVWNALDARAWIGRALAGRAQGDPRTLGQRRADALVEVCAQSLDRSLGGNVDYHQPPDGRDRAPHAAAPHAAGSGTAAPHTTAPHAPPHTTAPDAPPHPTATDPAASYCTDPDVVPETDRPARPEPRQAAGSGSAPDKPAAGETPSPTPCSDRRRMPEAPARHLLSRTLLPGVPATHVRRHRAVAPGPTILGEASNPSRCSPPSKLSGRRQPWSCRAR